MRDKKIDKSKIKVTCFSISLDGYGAGVSQNMKDPLGVRGTELHTWFFPTKTFSKMIGQDGGTEGIDNDFIEKSFENVGAWIMGRNMFGPIRGNWPDDEWKGWWGEEPPYHVPVFVLTHHERKPVKMKGSTVFHFVTDGIESAIEKAKEAAAGKDIRIGGGVSTIRQFLQAGYIDEIHFALSPIFLGSGEDLFSGIDVSNLGFNKIQRIIGEGATHFILTKEQI
jgi:dihydrofolate reductase